jgi:hypothetical protein
MKFYCNEKLMDITMFHSCEAKKEVELSKVAIELKSKGEIFVGRMRTL